MTRSRASRYAVLGALLALAVPFHARQAYDQVGELRGWCRRVEAPFARRAGGRELMGISALARDAGLREGDRLVAVESRPFSGLADLAVPLHRAAPGGTIEVMVERAGAGASPERITARIPLTARAAGDATSEWMRVALLVIVMPALCLALGFWVAGVRPHDPRAWLLLAMMSSFAHLGAGGVMHWGPVMRSVGAAYNSVFTSIWPASMMAFGLYFPERLPADRRWPWAKWVVIAPILLVTALRAVESVGLAGHLDLVAPLGSALMPLKRPTMALGMTAIGLFFASLGYKTGTASSPDARRRLILVQVGANLSLAPSLLLVVPALLRGTNPWSVAPHALTAALMMPLCLFPATMAYAIVAQRAMDVRVVIRQGARYALARRGVLALQIVLVVALVLTMAGLAVRPGRRRVEVVAVMGLGVAALALLARASERVGLWVDRRFFRDAYDAETILGDLADRVRTMVEAGPLLETVARAIAGSLHVEHVAILVEEGGAYRPARLLGIEEAHGVRFDAAGRTVERLRAEGGPVPVRLEDPASWVNLPEGPAPAAPSMLEALRSHLVDPAAVGWVQPDERVMLETLKSRLLLPLAVKESLPGFVSLGAKRSEEPYTRSDLRLLRSVATQAALALANSRLTEAIAAEVAQRERMNREVEIAREVQQRLFPQRLPPIRGLDYAGYCRAALRVGGDYYDFLPLPDGSLGIAVGDVSGKGIGAALLMASLQACLRGRGGHGPGGLAELIEQVSRLVFDASPDNRYATLFYAHYDPATRRLAYVNAGHCAPLLLRAAGGASEVVRLDAGGTVVGLFGDTSYQESTLALRPGDLLVAYTDGISEALNPDEEEYGESRLMEVARRCDGVAVADVIARVVQAVDAFAAGAEQHDDMTLVAARVT